MSLVDYSNLTEEQLNIVNEYMKNNMRKLKQLCYLVWGGKGIPNMEHDELYDDAMKVLLESVVSYNGNKSKFETYLRGNIQRSYKDWIRDSHRVKRCNLLLDKKGKIVKDENGKPIIIHNVSMDTPTEDGLDLSEKISSDYKIEDDTENDIDEILENCSSEMREYLTCILSKLQKNVLFLLSKGYQKEEIIEKLHIDSTLYADSIAAITSNKNTRKIQRLIRRNK